MKPFDALVLGLGPSLFATNRGWIRRRVTIGCNDCERHVRPDHLVVRDGPADMSLAKRIRIIQTQAATVWASNPDYWRTFELQHDDLRQLKAFAIGVDDYATMARLFESVDGEDSWLPAGKLTPTVAASLAFALGAKRIGLLGVDLLDDHESSKARKETDEWLASARILMLKKGTELANLSSLSTLRGIPLRHAGWIRRRPGRTTSSAGSMSDATNGPDGPWATP